MKDIKEYVRENLDGMVQLHKELCLIPAPSLNEGKRAEFCLNWYMKNGIGGAYIDDALNVVLPICADGSDQLSVIVAHTDTVFPDLEPMPYVLDGDIIRCPGVGDDTASLAVMMYVAKFFAENEIKPDGGILFVANSCEEGLGNLKGTRQIFVDYAGRVKQFVSFDGKLGDIADVCVGSTRYRVEAKTSGGHSYGAFGARNAIEVIAGMVKEIYSIELPKREGSKVTYNVGIIDGGTSVNTIAESASMLCEYRSDDPDLLDFMKARFERIFEEAKSEDASITVTVVGERPCERGCDPVKKEQLREICRSAMAEVTGQKVSFHSSSTDCNIPLSLGIPAICTAVYYGGGAHTRAEWMDIRSFAPGLEVGIITALKMIGGKV